MIMKSKNILILVSLLTFSCLFCSCNNVGNDDIVNAIGGKWQLTADGYYDVDDNIVMENVDENYDCYVEFSKNGKMKREYYSNGTCFAPDRKYEYKIDEQFIYENYTDKDNEFIFSYIINNNTLTLEYVQGNKPDAMFTKVIFTYKRLN